MTRTADRHPAVSSLADDLSLAHTLADAADRISTDRFRAIDLRVVAKPDLTPVSDADTAVERAVRDILSRARPDDSVLGEEYGEVVATGGGRRQWVIDPIDGTKNFVRGVPIWATLIALLVDGRPVVGLVSAPALGRRWWASTGHGAFAGRDATDATPVRVSGVRKLADASFCYSSLESWTQRGRLPAMLEIMSLAWRSRAYGDFYGYMLLAEGALEIMVEPELSLWDVAALVPIVTEAGGTFTDLAGTDLTGTDLTDAAGRADGSAVASNGPLHRDLLDRLG